MENVVECALFLNTQFSCSVMSNSATAWTEAHQAALSITNSRSLLKFMSIESVMHPTILSSVAPFFFCLQSFYASGSFQIEHSGLISFKMDWLDLLAVQGTLKESSPTPQFKSINSSALRFIYNPTLTSIHDCWKNQRLDYIELCWQSSFSAF